MKFQTCVFLLLVSVFITQLTVHLFFTFWIPEVISVSLWQSRHNWFLIINRLHLTLLPHQLCTLSANCRQPRSLSFSPNEMLARNINFYLKDSRASSFVIQLRIYMYIRIQTRAYSRRVLRARFIYSKTTRRRRGKRKNFPLLPELVVGSGFRASFEVSSPRRRLRWQRHHPRWFK